jgi:hypothetical protein
MAVKISSAVFMRYEVPFVGGTGQSTALLLTACGRPATASGRPQLNRATPAVARLRTLVPESR